MGPAFGTTDRSRHRSRIPSIRTRGGTSLSSWVLRRDQELRWRVGPDGRSTWSPSRGTRMVGDTGPGAPEYRGQLCVRSQRPNAHPLPRRTLHLSVRGLPAAAGGKRGRRHLGADRRGPPRVAPPVRPLTPRLVALEWGWPPTDQELTELQRRLATAAQVTLGADPWSARSLWVGGARFVLDPPADLVDTEERQRELRWHGRPRSDQGAGRSTTGLRGCHDPVPRGGRG